MTRSLPATIAGVIFVLLYIAAAVWLGDVVGRLHWALQFIYFALAGVLWVGPVLLLVIWASRRPG